MFVLYRRNAERERLCALLVASVPNLKPARSLAMAAGVTDRL
jgi:hypothetical protein